MHPEKLPVAMHPEKLPVAMHPEKLPVAGSVGGSFGWWQVLCILRHPLEFRQYGAKHCDEA